MATAIAAEVSTFRVPVDKALSDKHKFLSVLVAKIKSTSTKIIKNVITGFKRTWKYVSNGLLSIITHMKSPRVGAIASGALASETGYTGLVKIVSKAMNFLSRNFGKVVRAMHNGLDTVGYTISNFVGMAHKGIGAKLANFNMKFTDLRWKAIDKASKNGSVFGLLAERAYSSDTTVKVTTASAAILAFGHIIPKFATMLTSLPVIGSVFAFALSSGLATIATIAGVATGAAAVVVASSKLGPVVKAKAVDLKNKVMGKPVITLMAEDGTVTVEGAETFEQAVEAANEHVKEDIKAMETLVRGGRR